MPPLLENQIVALPNVLLSEFFGAEGKYVTLLSGAFPESKIIPRGNEVHLHGEASSVVRIKGVLNEMLSYYHTHGTLSESQVRACLDGEKGKEIQSTPLLYNTKGEKVLPRTSAQQAFIRCIEQKDLVFATGTSGTGKTFLSVVMALRFLKKKAVHRIILTRPMVEAGERLGFLPGDLKEKMNPYLRPMYDALRHLLLEEKLQYFLQHNIIEIAPLAYMRGRTLDKAFIILDEAQNTTSTQMKMLLTRMGTYAKVVITGDNSQVDLVQEREHTGLTEAISLLKDIQDVGIVHLDASNTMRHPLVKEIIAAYHQEKRGKVHDLSPKK